MNQPSRIEGAGYAPASNPNTEPHVATTIHDRTNLTSSQLMIWTGQRLHEYVPLYNQVFVFTIRKPLFVSTFRVAFQTFLNGCDALRTVFYDDDSGVPQQRVLPSLEYTTPLVDLASTPDPRAAQRDWTKDRAGRLLDLTSCAFDTALLRLGPDEYVWFLNQHHLITDFWSSALVYKTVAELYDRAAQGRLEDAAGLPPFNAYVAYEREVRSSPVSEKARAHWQRQLVGGLGPIQLYGKRILESSTASTRLTCSIDSETSQKLRDFAKRNDVRALTDDLSRFNLFLTTLFAYLYRISGRQQLIIGTPSHNRPTANFKETIGLFIEIVPLLVEVAEDDTFITLLDKVKRATASMLRFAQPGSATSRTGTGTGTGINVVLNYIHATFPPFAGSPVSSEWIHPGHMDDHHHLRLHVHDCDDTGCFELLFDFSEAQFDAVERRDAAGHLQRVLNGLLNDPTQSIRNVDLLSEQERSLVLTKFNRRPDREAPSPGEERHATVVQLFEAQVARTPDAPAVTAEGRVLTYRALDERANQLARLLRRSGVGPDVLVGLCTLRSPETVVGILATLKAGGAYVPIDPSYPPERIAYMLEDSGASVVLTQASLTGRLSELGSKIIPIDGSVSFSSEDGQSREHFSGSARLSGSARPAHPEAPAERESAKNLLHSAGSTDLAYVIYTSGSTGRPKGVMVEHGALSAYVRWAADYYLHGRACAFPLFTSLSFDLTVTSIFTPLISGGRIVVYEEEDAVVDLAVLRVLEDNAVDVVKLTPSHLSLIQGHDVSSSRIRTLIVGGEDFKTSLAASVTRSSNGSIEIYNEYGPTEATVGCMIHRYDPGVDSGPSVPIGRPAAQAEIYLLDDGLKPVPVGVPGEIFIAGPGLARGYLNKHDLSGRRFVPSPFDRGQLMYRSGDVGMWLKNGTMQYLGREDDQVKIRGVRIELGEIESAVLSHPSVTSCVVTVAAPSRDEAAVEFCVRCGLPSNYPGSAFDAEGVCNQCRSFGRFEDRARRYFRTTDDLQALFGAARTTRRSEYDCLMLLSGGKDSTYALCRLVEMGLNVLAFTLDNGYISEGAKSNIRRVTSELGVEHVFGTTDAMNAIFVDSLRRHNNVCNGCFKTLYTLSMKLAHEKEIPFIVTGLSRGQLFETRLTEELFLSESTDVDRIDETILEARKAYHRVDDAVYRLLPVAELQSDELFESLQFVDFYRYCDVQLDEMLSYLAERVPWIRPSDTGRSTNCLINDVGIFVHKRQRGYHNYAFPYSWDVRTGHKSRDAALAELNDDIDADRVLKILNDIGFPEEELKQPGGSSQLVAYYVSESPLLDSELRAHLEQTLPRFMIPSHFVRLDDLPLTANGKVDRSALPVPEERRPELGTTFVSPRTHAERTMAAIWADVLRVEAVGVHDNFFDLGGDSIMAIQISARATAAGLSLTPTTLFRHQTVEELANLAGSAPAPSVEKEVGTRPAPLAPIQHWFFERDGGDHNRFDQHWLLEVMESLDAERLRKAAEYVVRDHDALRLRFTRTPTGWQQRYVAASSEIRFLMVDLSRVPHQDQDRMIGEAEASLRQTLDILDGPMLGMAYIVGNPNRPDRLLLVVHHLVIDAMSWRILLKDLEHAYRQLDRGEVVELPRKTTSYVQWVEHLVRHAQTASVREGLEDWARGELHAPFSAANYVGPPPSPPNGGRKWREDSPGKPDEIRSLIFTDDETNAILLEAPAAFLAGVDELLLAALSSTMARHPTDLGTQICIEGHGRDEFVEGVDVSRTVGCFTARYPVTLEPTNDPVSALIAVKDRIRPLRCRSIEYGLLRYVCSDEEVRNTLAYLPTADVLFNYLGPLDRLIPASSVFKPAAPLAVSRPSGAPLRWPLEINAYVYRGRLHVDWICNSELRLARVIGPMTEEFARAIRQLVAERTQTEKQVVAPSDFPMARLDKTHLDGLSAQLRKADAARLSGK